MSFDTKAARDSFDAPDCTHCKTIHDACVEIDDLRSALAATEKERDWARAEVEHIRESLVRVWRDRAKRAEQGLSLARAWLTADDKVPPAWESEHYNSIHEASRAREEFSAWAATNPDLATSK